MKIPFRYLLLISSALIAIALMGCGFFVWLLLLDLPDIEALKNYQPPQSTQVIDRNGAVVGRFFDERRTVISVNKLPDHVKKAFIAAEDGDFFEHRGIDYFGLMRAVALEIKYRLIGGRRVGGSTITQQTARTMLLSSKQTYVRKLKEIVLAQRIEKALSKDAILHLYLNQIYFGNGAYGIEEAAQTYFSKSAKHLQLFEAAVLASIPKSPNRINPFSDEERLIIRQHYVLDQMVKHSFIDEKQAIDAKKAPLWNDAMDKDARNFASYFLRSVKTELLPKVSDDVIRKGGLKVYSTLDVGMQKAAEHAMRSGLLSLDKQTGYRGPLVRPKNDDIKRLKDTLEKIKERKLKNLPNVVWDLASLNQETISSARLAEHIKYTKWTAGKRVGAVVVSVNDKTQMATVDLGSQMASLPMSLMKWASRKRNETNKMSDVFKANDVILVKLHEQKKALVSLEQEPAINGGLVALDVKTGGVLAMVGGYDFDRSPFNRVMQAKRQPGSGLKPLIYAYAIDHEFYTAASLITDAPRAFLDPGTNEFWRPRNSTHRFLGDITFRRCLRSSINTCTITIMERIGLDPFLQFAKNVGLSTEATPYPRNLTIALGSAETYPINVANAMRIIANDGKFSPYHLIDGIKEPKAELKKLFVLEEKSIFRPETAFIISNILKDVVNDNKRLSLTNVQAELAGKTGTTNDARSTWFFGYTPSVLALVYVGYDDNRSIGSDAWGITTAFPIWAEFMNGIKESREPMQFSVPDGLEWRYIDRESGRAHMLSDASLNNHVMEAFIAGTAPEISTETRPIRKIPSAVNEAFAP